MLNSSKLPLLTHRLARDSMRSWVYISHFCSLAPGMWPSPVTSAPVFAEHLCGEHAGCGLLPLKQRTQFAQGGCWSVLLRPILANAPWPGPEREVRRLGIFSVAGLFLFVCLFLGFFCFCFVLFLLYNQY